MFIGQYKSKLTDKGRIVIPSRFRGELGSPLIVCRWYEGCLSIFTSESWKKIIDLAVGETLLTSPARDTERFLLGGAFEVDLDNQGRFVLPQALREYAQIVSELVFVGLRDRIEVWDLGHWDKRDKEIISQAEDLIRQVQETKISNIRGMRS